MASLSLHLGFPLAFFERRTGRAAVPENLAHFRKLRSTTRMDRDRLLVRLELLSEVMAAVEKHVELPAVDVPEYSIDEFSGDGEPETAAAAVRSAWGLGWGPIDNVVRLLESKGIIVVRPRVDSSRVDAFSTWTASRPVIVLSSDKGDAARSRFDAAHELGHLVMHHDVEPGRHVVEQQAHRFAAAFLLPAEAITRELPRRMSWPAFFSLKERWHVSLQALLYRARTVGTLSPDGYRRAQIHLSRQGWRENEPIDIGAPEEPALVERALELMDRELGIDREVVGHACALPGHVFTSLLSDAASSSPARPRVDLQ
jgi:Zn-dependent peptidase ImmA (M78 family)